MNTAKTNRMVISDDWLRRTAWAVSLLALSLLSISAVMLLVAASPSNINWLYYQVTSIVESGAPILGLIIVIRQPRNRIGWLFIVFGIAAGVNTLGNAIFFANGSQFSGYSSLEYLLMWLTEPANLVKLISPILLILWFPDGHLVSHKWRYLYIVLFLSIAILSPSLFLTGPDWNGGETAGGIVIDNPFGWLTFELPFFVGLGAFLSIVMSMFLAVVSIIIRYRSSGQQVRLQLRWFFWGTLLYTCFDFAPLLFIGETQTPTGFALLLYLTSYSSILFVYIAVGVAILRYRLYDIDIIIRRTLQYSLLTALLTLVYFGSVVLLQSLVENLTGQQSPLVIVLSTLAIAALFNPLHKLVQNFIDRRFYRKKYNAEQALSRFADAARDEVELDILTTKLVNLIDESLQPEEINLWLKQ